MPSPPPTHTPTKKLGKKSKTQQIPHKISFLFYVGQKTTNAAQNFRHEEKSVRSQKNYKSRTKCLFYFMWDKKTTNPAQNFRYEEESVRSHSSSVLCLTFGATIFESDHI